MRTHISLPALSAVALIPFLFAAPAEACECLATYPVCNEVRQSNVVFIGTVESIEPAFLDPWNPARLSLLPTSEIMRLQADGSPDSLAKLRDIYLKIFPNMPDHYREELESAKSAAEIGRAHV